MNRSSSRRPTRLCIEYSATEKLNRCLSRGGMETAAWHRLDATDEEAGWHCDSCYGRALEETRIGGFGGGCGGGGGDDLEGCSANGAGGEASAKTGGRDDGEGSRMGSADGAGGKVPAETRGDGSARVRKSTRAPDMVRFGSDGGLPENGLTLSGCGAGSNSTAAAAAAPAVAAAGAGGGAGATQNKPTSSGGSTSSHRGRGRTEGSGGDGDRHGNGKTTPSPEGSAAKKSKPDAPAVAGGKRPIAGAGAAGGGGGGEGTEQAQEQGREGLVDGKKAKKAKKAHTCVGLEARVCMHCVAVRRCPPILRSAAYAYAPTSCSPPPAPLLPASCRGARARASSSACPPKLI